jgi:ferrous iron transport protein A
MAEIPLSMLPEGSEAVIVGFQGGPGMVQKLADMGFVPGTRIKVVKNQRNGPMMVWVRGVTLGIGRGVATRIIVRQ